MSDLANIAAATAAGYKLTETDAGAGRSPRYRCYLAKMITGGSHQAGFEFRAEGHSDALAASARTNCLAALNDQRKQRWGAGATPNKDTLGVNSSFDTK